MKAHAKRLSAALLAVLLLLSLTACGNQSTANNENTKPSTIQQTEAQKKDGAAQSDTKADETKPDDTQGTTFPTTGTEYQQEIDPTTGKDKYGTQPVPDGKPAPVEPEDTTVDTSTKLSCTISISCSTILGNMDKCDEAKKGIVPASGIILSTATVSFSEGESVFDVLQRVCRDNGIHMEYSWTPMYNSAYIEGIANLYEFDVGDGSGWMYKVNGWFPNYGCSRYQVEDGDTICWVYTCDLGYDVGGGYMGG